MKVCNKCKTHKTYEYFSKNAKRPDGYQAWCKECMNEADKKYRNKPGKQKRHQKVSAQWNRNNPDKIQSYVDKLINSYPPGVYKITCLKTNKVYVGSSRKPYSRTAAHLSEKNYITSFNRALQADFEKYGREAFIWEFIREVDIKGLKHREATRKLMAAEKVEMENYSWDELYNINKILMSHPEIG